MKKTGFYIFCGVAALLFFKGFINPDSDKTFIYTAVSFGVALVACCLFLLNRNKKKIDEFVLLRTVKILVPSNYKNDSIVEDYKKSSFYSNVINLQETDENFAHVSQKLIPGKEYEIKFFESVNEVVSPYWCLFFLEKQKSLLVGLQGLLFLHLLKPELFEGRGVISFDKKEHLPKETLPFIAKIAPRKYKVDFMPFNTVIEKKDFIFISITKL